MKEPSEEAETLPAGRSVAAGTDQAGRWAMSDAGGTGATAALQGEAAPAASIRSEETLHAAREGPSTRVEISSSSACAETGSAPASRHRTRIARSRAASTGRRQPAASDSLRSPGAARATPRAT